MKIQVEVPKLDIDAKLHGTTRPLTIEQQGERRIVAALIDHLAKSGFSPCEVHSDEVVKTADKKSMMEEVFNLDDCWVGFKKGKHTRFVYFVLGNGMDMISDWRFDKDDIDGFNAAMEAFKAEELF